MYICHQTEQLKGNLAENKIHTKIQDDEESVLK